MWISLFKEQVAQGNLFLSPQEHYHLIIFESGSLNTDVVVAWPVPSPMRLWFARVAQPGALDLIQSAETCHTDVG